MPSTAVEVSIRVHKTTGGTGIPAMMRRVETNTSKASKGWADTAKGSAKRRAHVITGHMRESVDSVSSGPNSHTVFVGARYGVYEEYGTRYRPPHPWFRPAVEEAKVKFMADIKDVFKR